MQEDQTVKAEVVQDKGDKKRTGWIIACAAGAALIVLVAVIGILRSRSGLSAAVMRVIRYEGEVALMDEAEKALPLTENTKLYSGNILETKAFSKGYVALDDTKLVTLEELSRADFVREGKKLALHLREGSLFFQVNQKLDADESFDIETSTMLVGIRGTSGYVEVTSEKKEQLWLTDGEVHVSATHPVSGAVEQADVAGGEHLTVTYNDDGTIDIQVEDMPYIGSMPSMAVDEVISDAALLARVQDATGWSKEDMKERAAMGRSYVAVEAKAVDGIEHAAYYGYEELPEWVESWLDETIALCEAGDWNGAIDRALYDDLDKMYKLGLNDHIYHNGYKFYWTYQEGGLLGRNIFILPVADGDGYSLHKQNDDDGTEIRTYEYCACVDGMYNGEAYRYDMWEDGRRGTVPVTNGLYDGELVYENGQRGTYSGGEWVEGFDEIGDYFRGTGRQYIAFGLYRCSKTESSAVEGAVKIYPY